jgi:NAD(P)H-dependent flavin oxidoreductase YrpB (nitropropane dioxygenase family)
LTRAEQATLPLIIQGGMGAGISNWRLARAVARHGQLGVVSGVGLDTILVRRIEDGDPGGFMRQAMAQFPLHHALEALERYLRPRHRESEAPYTTLPMFKVATSVTRQQLTMLSGFVEVWLAKAGHDGPVGINLLTKIQPPTLATLYGAMLAGVDYVLMGAGIPREIPGALDLLARHEAAELRLEVTGLPAGAPPPMLRFDPREHWERLPPPLRRPKFLPIVASTLLATVLVRKATGQVDGLVIEGPTAGGHNAPPRGELQVDERGEPIYGERDVVDLAKVRELGVPFWLAGGVGSPSGLRESRAVGAAGIQVGTLFAYCEESGLADDLKHSVLEHAARGAVRVRTDMKASPTGYPFKVVEWDGNPAADVRRKRVCDLGYLREAYVTPAGTVAFRCRGEPEDSYVKKGGLLDDTEGRQCLCNSLLATAGYPQHRVEGDELPIVTSGDELVHIGEFLAGRTRYHAEDVLDYLLGEEGEVAQPK